MSDANTDEQDWHTSIMQKLVQSFSAMVARYLKNFTIVNCKLYYRGGGGVIAQALYMANAKEELQLVHELSRGDNEAGLYRHLQR